MRPQCNIHSAKYVQRLTQKGNANLVKGSLKVIWYVMVWFGLVWFGTVWYGAVSCRVVSCRAMACHVMSCHVISSYIRSDQITWHDMTRHSRVWKFYELKLMSHVVSPLISRPTINHGSSLVYQLVGLWIECVKFKNVCVIAMAAAFCLI